MKQKISPSYDMLAPVYNIIMKNIDYKNWAKYIADIIKTYHGRKANILELGGGTGKLALELNRYFKRILTSDLSFNMLKEIKGDIPKVCCNMLAMPFKKKFDVVFTAFDSINYITSEKKIKKVFDEVSKILEDDGIFMFDCAMESNSIKYSRDFNRQVKLENNSFRQSSDYNKETKIHKNIFRFNLDGIDYFEIHRQKIYSFETWFKLIEKSPLYIVECLDCFSYDPGDHHSDRLQFILKKKNVRN